MALLRYADQEAANIAAAELRARQHNAFNATLAKRRLALTAVAWAEVPDTAASAGKPGEIAVDETHLYLCVDDNTWKRVALAAW